MAEAHLIPPKDPPPLNIPPSTHTVKVSVIDSTSRLRIPMSPFLQPDYTGHPDLTGPCLVFLIEHPHHKPILFDLGVRKDWHNLPQYQKWLDLKWNIFVKKDVATILKDHGWDVDGGAIESIILSHHHWDHVGDPSTFPPSTDLVVGPGFKEAHMPGYPTRKEATMLETDFAGRRTREISFAGDRGDFRIGRFNAHDYFGDGSFYLLDTPGHSVGHICGLARTTENTFVFMGGDASHHGGEFRPTPYLPLPRELPPGTFKRRPTACPGHLLEKAHAAQRADAPFYQVTPSFAHDKPTADWTIEGLGEFDAHENVLMLMAHDDAVVDPARMDFYPREVNDWFEKGTAREVKWVFLGDFEDALEAREKGGEAFRWKERGGR